MARQRNNTIFTGTYKTALRRPSVRKFCTPRSKPRNRPIELSGGPLKGHTVFLSDHTCTLPITVGGHTGRYVGNMWHPA